MRREGQELRILGRIFGKCRVGYRDKTLKVIAGGLGTYIRLYLTYSSLIFAETMYGRTAGCYVLGFSLMQDKA